MKYETSSKGCRYISSFSSTAINHLRFWKLVSPDVRSTADEYHTCKHPSAPHSPTSQRWCRNTVLHIETSKMLPPISLDFPDPPMVAGPSMSWELQNLSQLNGHDMSSHTSSPSWPSSSYHSPCEGMQMDEAQVDNSVFIKLNRDGNNQLVQQNSSVVLYTGNQTYKAHLVQWISSEI